MAQIAESMIELVGNTPIIRLNVLKKKLGLNADILVKAECFNPLSSAKDRAALFMVEDAERKGILKEVDGTVAMEDVFQAIIHILGA